MANKYPDRIQVKVTHIMKEEIRRLAFDERINESKWARMAFQEKIDRVKKERRGED